MPKSQQVFFDLVQSWFFRRYVITAAHCQHKSNPRKQIAEVVLGEYDLSKDPDCDGPCRKAQRFAITPADVLVHEDWNLAKVWIEY